MKAPSDEIYDKSMQGTCGLQLCCYFHSLSCYCLTKLRNSTKIRIYSSSRSSIMVSIESTYVTSY